jgi:hypothetical protein
MGALRRPGCHAEHRAVLRLPAGPPPDRPVDLEPLDERARVGLGAAGQVAPDLGLELVAAAAEVVEVGHGQNNPK